MRTRGFTLVEMLVTLALVAIAASVVLPLASMTATRTKETELKRSLRTIRTALDEYKKAADSGIIEKQTGASGYPPSLEVLTKGVPRAAVWGAGTGPLVFLRRIPRDPFAKDPSVANVQTWEIRPYSSGQADVFDVSSKSSKTAIDGSLYKDW